MSSDEECVHQSILSSQSSEVIPPTRKKITFLRRMSLSQEALKYKESWLNKISDEPKLSEQEQQILEKMKEMEKTNRDQFKYLFQIPMVVSDPAILSRKSTYEVFSKEQKKDLYNQQMKKVKVAAKSISQKEDYKDVLSNLQLNKAKEKKASAHDNCHIYAHELWSEKYAYSVYDQSRLKVVTDLLTLKKIKITKQEQIRQFEKFFNQNYQPDKAQPKDLVAQVQVAFGGNYQHQNNTLEEYFTAIRKPSFTKQNRNISLHSRETRPYTREVSRAGSSLQLETKKSQIIRNKFNLKSSTSAKLLSIINKAEKASGETKEAIQKVNNFIDLEHLLVQQKIEDRQYQIKQRMIKQKLNQNSTRQQNCFVQQRMN